MTSFNSLYNKNNIIQDDIFSVLENYVARHDMSFELLRYPIGDEELCACTFIRQGRMFVMINSAISLLYADNEPSAEVYGAAADRQQASIVFDEIHTQPKRQLYDVLTKGSSDAKQNPLHFIITTAGNDRHSIAYELHTKAVDILEGRRVDPTFYPVVYGLKDDEDWEDEANWYKVNPSLGYTVDIERLRDAYREAKQNPADEVTFKWLRCNMWVSSAVAWIPEETIPRRVKSNSVSYDIWEKQGYLMSTEGNVIHYGFIEKFIMDLSEEYHILEIAVDKWNATHVIQNLEDNGLTMVPFGQGFASMSAPTKKFYRLLMEGKIIHGGHPVMRWMAGNVVVDTDPAGNIKVTKAK